VPASSFEVHFLGEVDSTNDWLLASARAGAPDRTVAVAEFQRRGRGRLDRKWEAPPGSALLCSVLLRCRLAPEDRQLATVAVGLAATSACRELSGAPVALKWPNDLVVGSRKLGGILAESDGREDEGGAVALVVGLGVNLTWPGPPEAAGTSLLEASGVVIARDALLTAYLEALESRAAALDDAPARDAMVRDYLDELATIGHEVRVEQADGSFTGVATGITDRGHLVVAQPDGLRVVTAGDVVHLRRADEGEGPSE